jgi:hypothetical protein
VSQPFNPAWRIVGRTMVWQRGQGEWERNLVRRTSGSKSYWSTLIHVQPSKPVCLACLGQTVSLEPDEEFPDGVLHCHACGVRYGFL